MCAKAHSKFYHENTKGRLLSDRAWETGNRLLASSPELIPKATVHILVGKLMVACGKGLFLSARSTNGVDAASSLEGRGIRTLHETNAQEHERNTIGMPIVFHILFCFIIVTIICCRPLRGDFRSTFEAEVVNIWKRAMSCRVLVRNQNELLWNPQRWIPNPKRVCAFQKQYHSQRSGQCDVVYCSAAWCRMM